MRKITFMLGIFALTIGAATAQVKIKDGTVADSSNFPNGNAVLELESSKRGLLLPRVALTETDLPAPLTAHVKGMFVYDTVSAGSGSTAVAPGAYYNDGTQWIRLTNSLPANAIFVYGQGSPIDNATQCGTVDINSSEDGSTYPTNTIYTDTLSTSSTVGQTWICDGKNWQPYSVPASSTAWYIAHTYFTDEPFSENYTDAGGNKTSYIWRPGGILLGDLPYNAAQIPGFINNNYAPATLMTSGNIVVGGMLIGTSSINGTSNIIVGGLYNNTTGNSNVAVGGLNSNTTGNLNVALGVGAGGGISTGNNNIVIGTAQDVAADGSNQLNIGGAIFGTGLSGSVSAPAGNIGIAVTNPNSTLQVGGSVTLPITTTNTIYSVKANDYTVVVTVPAAPVLPDPATCTGRMYRIVNQSTYALSVANVTYLSGTSLPPASAMLVQSNGNTWVQVGN